MRETFVKLDPDDISYPITLYYVMLCTFIVGGSYVARVRVGEREPEARCFVVR